MHLEYSKDYLLCCKGVGILHICNWMLHDESDEIKNEKNMFT